MPEWDTSAALLDDAEFAEGDYTLVSSDGVRFRTASYHLFHALRDASSDDKAMVFADPEIETADIVRAFLRFITKGVLPVAWKHSANPTNGLDRLPRLVRFLDKYQCHTAQRFAMVCVREGLRGGIISPLCAFVTGATLGDDITVTAALGADPVLWAAPGHESRAIVMSAFKVNPFGDEAKASLEEGDEDAHVLDPASMPYIAWSQTPPEYLWALSRAWKKARGADGKGGGDLLWYFEELLRAAKETSLVALTTRPSGRPESVSVVGLTTN
ncbi:hypothetical protein Q8F55_003485 [Vanrija albida]|uniref:BTB domain-containing protein n=1 Tax=Vanrija albida TaxID=181172 RepID=A0ABR3Q4N6_9TREE